MAKYDFDDEDGVWRTVGGRRIFIREGQSLSDAMKSSGKFKSAKRNIKGPNSKEVKEINKKIDEEFGTEEKAKQYEQDKGLRDLIKDKDALNKRLLEMKKSGEYKELLGENDEKSMKEAEDRIKQQKETPYSKMSDQELKDELEHNRRMLGEMERRLSGRYTLTEEQRDELENRAGHYEATKDDIRDELRRRKEMGPVQRENEYTKQKETNDSFAKKEIDRLNNEISKLKNGEGIYAEAPENWKEIALKEAETLKEKYEKTSSGSDKPQSEKYLDRAHKEVKETRKVVEGHYAEEREKLKGYIRDNYKNPDDYLKDYDKENAESRIGTRRDKFDKNDKNDYFSEQHRIEKSERDDVIKMIREIKAEDRENDRIIADYERKNSGSKADKVAERLGLKNETKNTKYENNRIRSDLANADTWEDIHKAIDNIDNDYIKDYLSRSAQKLEENENGPWKSASYLAKEYNFYEKEYNRDREIADTIKKESLAKTTSNNAYKKAFEEYKKQHPNTKLTFNKFIDMSEGK